MCPGSPLGRRDLVYIVSCCVVRVIEIVEVLIELIVVSDEIMRLVLGVVR